MSMLVDGLLFAILDTSSVAQNLTINTRLREITLSWSRFGYHGPIIEGKDLNDLLNRAVEMGFQYCLIQSPGHVICETWWPRHWGHHSLRDLLEAMLKRNHLAHGHLITDVDGTTILSSRCLFVNLKLYEALKRPAFGGSGSGFLQAAAEAGCPVSLLPSSLAEHVADLDEPDTSVTTSYLSEQLVNLPETQPDTMTPAQHRFLTSVAVQLRKSQYGYFPFNIEPYDDVRHPPKHCNGPLSALYSVTAGLKPNMILHTHGFNEQTRVVYYDYSTQALEIRRYMLAEWDGEDYPRFLSHLFRRFPHPETYYQLWAGCTPDNLASNDLDTFWREEINKWGSEAILRDHWLRYRELPHQFVQCNILTQWEKLLEKLTPEGYQVIWWSNAFFTFYSNWLYSLEQRQDIYQAWIEKLAFCFPNIYLYGADYANISVNQIQAFEYQQALTSRKHNFLNPLQSYGQEIRF